MQRDSVVDHNAVDCKFGRRPTSSVISIFARSVHLERYVHAHRKSRETSSHMARLQAVSMVITDRWRRALIRSGAIEILPDLCGSTLFTKRLHIYAPVTVTGHRSSQTRMVEGPGMNHCHTPLRRWLRKMCQEEVHTEAARRRTSAVDNRVRTGCRTITQVDHEMAQSPQARSKNYAIVM